VPLKVRYRATDKRAAPDIDPIENRSCSRFIIVHSPICFGQGFVSGFLLLLLLPHSVGTLAWTDSLPGAFLLSVFHPTCWIYLVRGWHHVTLGFFGQANTKRRMLEERS